MAFEIFRQPNDRQIEIRLLINRDQSLFDEILAGGQFGVFALPQGSIVLHTDEPLRQDLEQLDVQLACEIGIWPGENTRWQWG